MANEKIHIGTSGWVYKHWYEVFYPDDIKSNELLDFYSQHFLTVELNTSFYHLPKTKVFLNWYKKTPKNFIFSVKASRFITHFKKLQDIKKPLKRFFDSAKELKEKLGPVLFQLPPSLKVDKRILNNFLKTLPKKNLIVLEPRHESWFNKEIYDILKKHDIALCIADSPKYPLIKIITAKFIYLRFHGSKSLYRSKYPDKELRAWSKRIKKWQKEGLDIYAYFNNDAEGYAVENAKELRNLLNA